MRRPRHKSAHNFRFHRRHTSPRSLSTAHQASVRQHPDHLPDVLQHGAAVRPALQRLCVDAGDVGFLFAIVRIHLRSDGHLQGLHEVLLAEDRLDGVPAAPTRLQGPDLLGRGLEQALRRLVEGREPGGVGEVREAAAKVEAWRVLALAVARRAEAVLGDALVAEQGRASPGLLAGEVVQRLSLALLRRLHQCQPAGDVEHLDLGANVLGRLAHLGNGRGLRVRRRATGAAAALLGELADALGGAACRPPLLHLLPFRRLGLEGQRARLQQGAAATTVPLLDEHALHEQDRVALEELVVLLGTVAPDGHGHAQGRVVGDGNLTLDELLALLRREGEDRAEAHDDAAKITGAWQGLLRQGLEVHEALAIARQSRGDIGEVRGGTRLGPPSTHALGLRELRCHVHGPRLHQGAIAAAVELTDQDALEADYRIAFKDFVLLLGALAPQRDADAGRSVVGDGDLALGEVLAILGGEGNNGFDARDDAAEVGGEWHCLVPHRVEVGERVLHRFDHGDVSDLLDLGVAVEDDLVAVVAPVVLPVRNADAAPGERVALALLDLREVHLGHRPEEAGADLAARLVEELDVEDLAGLPVSAVERPLHALHGDTGADDPLGMVGGDLADGKERLLSLLSNCRHL
mmetsp:Transcript_135231/g.431762  ORF Transcript_135231/g.431762 Transcript_135231/m.431762 type:complete len:634 (-) Transcript_135231:82-1983(-)